jgi:hypothetical protein
VLDHLPRDRGHVRIVAAQCRRMTSVSAQRTNGRRPTSDRHPRASGAPDSYGLEPPAATASGGPSVRPPEAEAGYELRMILPSCGARVVVVPELATVVVELPVLTTTVPFVNCLVITPSLMVASPVGLPSWLALL